MTAIEWTAFLVLLICGLAAGAAVTLSNGAVTRAIRRLEQTYRRQKALELEELQAQAVARRRSELQALLGQPGGWQQVLDQLLADALPQTGQRIGDGDLLDLNLAPAPRFTVSGADGHNYLFTTSPQALREVKMLDRRDEAIPLDAALHPAARVEVQAVWEHLAQGHLRGQDAPTLGRQAAWYLVVREVQTSARKGKA